MIQGARIALRPVRHEDWPVIESWGRSRDTLWGPYQRFQLDHVPLLRDAYDRTHLLSRDMAFVLIETTEDHSVVGFVRYILLRFPDADIPYPEIGLGLVQDARGKGYATDAARALIEYLFCGYPTEKIAAFTDVENWASRRLLERLSFRKEGALRRATFRDGRRCGIGMYKLLRGDWNATPTGPLAGERSTK